MLLLLGCALSASLALNMLLPVAKRHSGQTLAKNKDALSEKVKYAYRELARRIRHIGLVRETIANLKREQLAESCNKDIPELLDIVSLGLSAGLSFDASLGLYCAHSNTRLSDEFRKTMSSWQMGLKSRSQALDDLAQFIGGASLKRFCASVSEALLFGTPLAATLEQQADVMREEQRTLSQERIEEVPVRMLIPLGTLIVPAMLLAILGPLLASAFSN